MSKVQVDTIDTRSGTSTMQIGSTNTSTINIGVSGDTVNIPSGVTIANAGTATGFGTAGTESFFVSKSSSADQTLTVNTDTKMTFDTEGVDVGNNFASNKYTVPSAGKYFFEAQVKGETNLDSKIQNFKLYIYKNGSIAIANDNELTAGYEKKITKNVSGILDFAASDYLEVYLHIGYESSATISAKGGSQATTHFLGFKLA